MIGVFDSGIGGLAAVRELMNRLPGYDIVYFGDTGRAPYGNKSPETVAAYAAEGVRFLLDQGAVLIVSACHTTSSSAWEHLSGNYDLPLFEAITPAAERAVALSKNLRIGVIGTRATIASGAYETKILEKSPEAKVYSRSCPLLVPLAEEGWVKKPETVMIVKKYLHPLKVRQIDTLILGCTHYALLSKIIQRKIGRRVHIVDAATATASRVTAYLASAPRVDDRMSKNARLKLFVSDITDPLQKAAGAFFGRPVELVCARPK